MSPYARAVAIGATVAVLAAGAVAALVLTGGIERFVTTEPPARVLVMFVAPDAEDTDSVPVAIELSESGTSAIGVSTWTEKTIPGTSASSPRTAFPFGGGELVAESVADATPWVVIPATTWSRLVDDAGGLEIVLPTQVSAYRDGELTLLEPGRQTLSGDDVVALCAALEFLETSDRDRVISGLETGSARLITDMPMRLAGLVGQDRATSSLEPADLRAFATDAP